MKSLHSHLCQLVGFDYGCVCVINPNTCEGVHSVGVIFKKAYLYDSIFNMKLTGKIIHGAGRGKGLGFPTLNIEGGFSELEQGVYAVWVEVGGQRHKGAMNYGPQPTFGGAAVRVEVFLLDFEGEVYGEIATVEVVKKIRDTRKFDSAEDLKAQIAEDVRQVRAALS